VAGVFVLVDDDELGGELMDRSSIGPPASRNATTYRVPNMDV
jgi:hypothetical protein